MISSPKSGVHPSPEPPQRVARGSEGSFFGVVDLQRPAEIIFAQPLHRDSSASSIILTLEMRYTGR